MSEEFYNYVANRIIRYFELESGNLHDGDRFCFKLDAEELVGNVYAALEAITREKDIQGSFSYKEVYKTFTLKLKEKEVVVAAQVDGMTSDFFATLRNIPTSENRNPILMITSAPIDTISSATRNLSAKGAPFCADELLKEIEKIINDSKLLSLQDRTLLLHELERKESDRYADRDSLLEYKSLLVSANVGKVAEEDWLDFRLLPDAEGLSLINDPKKIEQRLDENHRDFEMIDRAFRYGALRDDLDGSFDSKFIDELEKKKRQGVDWFQEITYAKVSGSKAKKEKKLDVENGAISAYSGRDKEYLFPQDEKLFVRDGGSTKAKQREKHILVYNPDGQEEVALEFPFNMFLPKDSVTVEKGEASVRTEGKRLYASINADGCVFSKVVVKDPNNKSNVFTFKICVLNLHPSYLKNIQTCYRIDGNGKKRRVVAEGIKGALVINPGAEKHEQANLEEGGVYACDLDTELKLTLNEDSCSSDNGKIVFELSLGGLQIPVGVSDDKVTVTQLTVVRAFKIKNERRRGFEYRDGKIIMGTVPYSASGDFKEALKLESFFVENQACYVVKNLQGEYASKSIAIPDELRSAYVNYLSIFQKRRQLPSLAYLDDELREAAKKYVSAFKAFLEQAEEGSVLSQEHNDALRLGTVYDQSRHTIAFSPVHPLNAAYQLQLLEEEGLDKVRDDIVGRLTSANLLPYVKDDKQTVYEIIEQDESPEWRYYTPFNRARLHEIRDFAPKLVAEKIKEYYAHFEFLFDDVGDRRMILSLHHLGDCREVFLGIIRYFKGEIKKERLPEDILNFEIHIYDDPELTTRHNDFSVLSNLKRTKEYLREVGEKDEDNAELASMLVTKIRRYERSEADEKYRYAHIAFYEMKSNDKCGNSDVKGLTTGVSLKGVISGVPSVLDQGWYKTGFGLNYAQESFLNQFAELLNSTYCVAYSSSTYISGHCVTTEVSKSPSDELDKVYSAANWVVFVDPKVDLSFFYQDEQAKDLLIIHYGDQNSSASGYNAITVTRKSEQYERIISQELEKKNVQTAPGATKRIINFFNAVNGRWLLRLISSKRALNSAFSREKMSVVSAVKFAMAYYGHVCPNVTWVPISLEELLRVSGNTGLSQKDGLLSAKNLAFERGATCDDLLLIGFEKLNQRIQVYLHPVEVKIGKNDAGVVAKAKNQICNTYRGLLQALWPDDEDERKSIERKVVRNFIMQLAILACEKMKLYEIYPEGKWDFVLDENRKSLLNDEFEISERANKDFGIGTVVSFKENEQTISRHFDSENHITIFTLPEKDGYEFLVESIADVARDIERSDLFSTNRPVKRQENLRECEVQIEVANEVAVEPQSDNLLGEETPSDDNGADEAFVELSEESTPVLSELPPEQEETPREIRVLFGENQATGTPLFWRPGNTGEIFHPNTGIIGTMGTGKTQFTQSLVAQLYRERVNNLGSPDLGILIFDYKGDYNESKTNFLKATNAKVLKPYHLPYNPLALSKPRVFKPLLPIHVANTFSETLSSVYHLGTKQRNALLESIKTAYLSKGINPNDPNTWSLPVPTFADVFSIYSENESIKKGDSLDVALCKLSNFELFEAESCNTKSLFDLLNGVVVVDLSGYDSDLQNLVVAITLDLFYAQMQTRGSSKLTGKLRQLTKIILVDEADNILSEGFPSLKKILKEGREFGVGKILSTQSLKHFGNGDDDFSKYILTWVVHNVSDLKNSDIRFVFNTEANGEEEAKLFGDVKKLQKHHSIVKIGNNPKPIYVRDKAFWELFGELQTASCDREESTK